MKQHLIIIKIYATIYWVEGDFNIRSHFSKRKIYPNKRITPKIEKEKLYGLTQHIVLMFQQISVKKSSAYWINISQKRISFVNCSTVKMSKLMIVLFPKLKGNILS